MEHISCWKRIPYFFYQLGYWSAICVSQSDVDRCKWGRKAVMPFLLEPPAQWGGWGWQELRVISLLTALHEAGQWRGKDFPSSQTSKGSSEGLPGPGGCLAWDINQTLFTPVSVGVVVSLTQPHSWDLIKTQFPLLFNLWGLACRIKRLQTKSPICETLLNSSCYAAYLYSIKLIRNESADPLWIKQRGVSARVHTSCSLLREHLCKMIMFIFIQLEFSKSAMHKLL